MQVCTGAGKVALGEGGGLTKGEELGPLGGNGPVLPLLRHVLGNDRGTCFLGDLEPGCPEIKPTHQTKHEHEGQARHTERATDKW